MSAPSNPQLIDFIVAEAQLLDAIRIYIEAATDVRMRNHPLYDLARSLDDSLDDVPQTPLH